MPFADTARSRAMCDPGSSPKQAVAGDSAERRRLRAELNAAMRAKAFTLHYQQRQCLRSGDPTGAEALLRWPHRKRGMVPPAAFTPAAEEAGQIIRLGGWALREACAEAATWDRGIVSVNVSARQLADSALLTQLAVALDSSGLNPERLEIELTEAMLIDVDTEMLLTLSAIRDAGVGLTLDDFGAGHASLAMLKRLPLTALKLDRSLVRDLPTDREDAAIVRAVIETGHALGLLVVAEGIETEAQRAFLAACDCDEGQGLLFGAPAPPERMRGHFRSVFTATPSLDEEPPPGGCQAPRRSDAPRAVALEAPPEAIRTARAGAARGPDMQVQYRAAGGSTPADYPFGVSDAQAPWPVHGSAWPPGRRRLRLGGMAQP